MATYEDKAKLILQGRKNANLLVEILEKIDSASNDEIVEIISSLQVVFNYFLSQRLWHEQYESEICESADPFGNFEHFAVTNIFESTGKGEGELKETKVESDSRKDAERIYSLWVHQQYLTFVKELLRLVSHRHQPVQRSAFDCLISFLVADYHASISSPKYSPEQCYFPASLFFRIIDGIFFSEFNAFKAQLKYFEQRYLRFDDIQFYTLKGIHRIINGKSKSITNNDNVKDAICSLLLRMLSYNKDEELKGFVIEDSDKLLKISKDSKEMGKLFSSVWLSLLHVKLSKQSLKLILVNLHETIMPVLEDPKLLIDFLTDCYSLEGPIGLLALNGLFLLIQNYNLDYPDFFRKLYNVLDAGTFEVKYRDKFLALTDLFLSSLNLPGYMAAAFIKKLARISLRVSPDAIKIILVMIENLMKRHPSCRVLIHRKVGFSLYFFFFFDILNILYFCIFVFYLVFLCHQHFRFSKCEYTVSSYEREIMHLMIVQMFMHYFALFACISL